MVQNHCPAHIHSIWLVPIPGHERSPVQRIHHIARAAPGGCAHTPQLTEVSVALPQSEFRN